MVDNKSSARRSANAAIRLSIPEYVSKLGSLFGTIAEFSGPGPIDVQGRASSTPYHEFAVGYLFKELFSKFDDGISSSEKEQACLRRFNEAEELCRETNQRFKERSFLYHGSTKPGYTAGQAMWLARRKIEWLLGPYDDAEIIGECGFGKGASTRLSRVNAHIANKIGGIPHAAQATATFARDILTYFPLWEAEFSRKGTHCEVVAGNKLVSVPKNYKTDRMIAVEPDWNLFIQKGIGGAIRSRLRKVGIDLATQENNQFLAALGSIDESMATIDLSMASDCLSFELVRFCTPPDWFDALEQCRSPVGFLASPSKDAQPERIVYEKFSSMGNGSTFELETLIFWALSSAVIDLMKLEDRRCLVYGDDIIVPTAAYLNVIDVLEKAGFKTNLDKTFGAGPFRESCGMHSYEGIDVTPIYVREDVKTLDRLFLLHNNTCRMLERYSDCVIATPEEVCKFLEWIRAHAPDHWQKPRLPRLDVGDGAFFGSFEECSPSFKRDKKRRGFSGVWVKTLRATCDAGPVKATEYEQYLATLYSLDRRPPDFRFSERVVRSASWIYSRYGVRFFEPEKAASPPDLRVTPWRWSWSTGVQLVVGQASAPWWTYA